MLKFKSIFIVIMVATIALFSGFAIIRDVAKADITHEDVLESILDIKVNKADYIEGKFISSDGTVVSECLGDSHYATVKDPYAWRLLGYNTPKRGSSGLRKRFEASLYDGKKIDSEGNSIYLTIDNRVQTKAYESINELNWNTSAVVLENKTGRILALAESRADKTIDFDLNNIDEVLESAVLPDGYLLPCWSSKTAPGSVMKILTAIPIAEDEQLREEGIYDNGSVKLGNINIKNYKNRPYSDKEYNDGPLTLREGLKYSSNVYFTSMYYENFCAADLESLFEKALLGQNWKLDFADFTSNMKVENTFQMVQSCFGQGESLWCPLQAAASASAVINDGKLLRPYAVEKVVSADGKTVGKATEPEQMSTVCSPEISKIIRDDLQVTAASYDKKMSGTYAKTGTAQMPHRRVQGCFFIANKEYTVYLSSDMEEDGTGSYLKETAFNILQYTTKVLSENPEKAFEDNIINDSVKPSLIDRIKAFFKDSADDNSTNDTNKRSDGLLSRLKDLVDE